MIPPPYNYCCYGCGHYCCRSDFASFVAVVGVVAVTFVALRYIVKPLGSRLERVSLDVAVTLWHCLLVALYCRDLT